MRPCRGRGRRNCLPIAEATQELQVIEGAAALLSGRNARASLRQTALRSLGHPDIRRFLELERLFGTRPPLGDLRAAARDLSNARPSVSLAAAVGRRARYSVKIL